MAVIAAYLTLGASACGGIVYPKGELSLKEQTNAAQIARGKMLAATVCGACHLDPSTQAFTGRELKDIPKMPGTISSADITHAGLKDYTPQSLAYLLRTDIKRDGTVSPFMAFPHLSDDDMTAILTFLWSDDPMVQPGHHEVRPMELTTFGQVLFANFKPTPLPQGPVAHPNQQDEIAYGRYLVYNLNCFECHSSSFIRINKLEPEKSKGYMGGGSKMLGLDGKKIEAPNLTPHTTGIADWHLLDFDRAIRRGINPHNQPLRYPMPVYSALGDAEVKALFAYLKSIPPIENRTGDEMPLPPGNKGKTLYAQYGCQGCHGEKGKGVADLTKAYTKYNDSQIISLIKNPRDINVRNTMPDFEGVIKEADYQPLIEYVKQLGREAAGTQQH